MRSRDVALTGTETINAAGAHTVVSYLDVVTPATVATARINQADFTYPLITLTVDTTANWTDVQVGMDAWVGTSAGASDIGIYRVKGSTSTTLVIGETAEGDAGLLIRPLRTSAFADNQYITIVQRRSAWSVYPLISSGVFYEDYNVAPDGSNQHPPSLTFILCQTSTITQHNHIWTFVDDGQSYATITFTVTTEDWPGISTASYAWTIPGSWTVTAGNVLTATFTAQVPAQVANYEIECQVYTDFGFISTRYVEVWVKARTGANAPLPITSLDQVTWNTSGAALSFTLNDNLLANIPDGSMVVIAQERLFNGAVIQSAVSQFVGWVIRIGQNTQPGLRTAQPQFVTIDGLLSLRRGTSQVWETSNSVSTWQQVTADLCTLSFAQFWLLLNRARGVLELFDFMPGSVSPTGQRLPRIDVKAQTLWQQLTSLADAYQKRVIGCDPDGSIWISQHPSLNPTYPRYGVGVVVVRDTHDASIYHDVDWPRELYPKVGLVEGSAFTWDGVSTQPVPLLSIAPGFTPGQGSGDQKCENQVVDTQATLNTLTGNVFASLNPDYPEVTANYEGMRGALLKPAQYALVHLQIPAYLSLSGVALDRYAIPTEVSETYQVGGVVDTSIRFDIETTGVAGATKPVPPPNTVVYPPSVVVVTPPPGTRIPEWNGVDVLPTNVVCSDAGGAHWAIATTFNPLTNVLNFTSVSTGLGSGYSIWATADPYNYNRYYDLRSDGIYVNENLLAGNSWSMVVSNTTLFGSSGRLGRHIAGSINRRGWFAVVSGSNTFVYTTDYWATIHKVSIDGAANNYSTTIDRASDGHCTFWVSPRNSLGDGLICALLYVGGGNSGLYFSNDWGASWAANGVSLYTGSVSGSPHYPYTRDDSSANSNDGSQWLYVQGGAHGTSGGNYLSKDGGATFSTVWSTDGSNFPASSVVGYPLQTFTGRGDILLSASAKTGAGSDIGGVRVSSGSGASHLSMTQLFLGSEQMTFVQGYPVHSQFLLTWARDGTGSSDINWSSDSGVTYYNAAKPSFFTGYCAYVECNIASLVGAG